MHFLKSYSQKQTTRKMERKKELRKLISLKKAEYSDALLKELSAKILINLENLAEFQVAKTVLLYHSLKDEVYTHDFIEKWAVKKRIILPVVVGDVLELRLYTSQNDLCIGAYGIAEPTGQLFTDYDAIDLAVVPGVAFNRMGNRLGRGKGYYDKLLPSISATKVGICFPFQLIEEIPTEKFDICMNTVIFQ